MKTLIIVLLIGMVVVASCSEEIVEPYTRTDDYVFFMSMSGITAQDSLYDYNRTIYLPSGNKTKDTVYLKIGVGGNYARGPRKVKLEQYTYNDPGYIAEEAIAGVDYIAFDDSVMDEHYTIPADSLVMNIPVIITSPSSSPRKVLNLRLVENENFKVLHRGTQELGISRVRIKIGY